MCFDNQNLKVPHVLKKSNIVALVFCVDFFVTTKSKAPDVLGVMLYACVCILFTTNKEVIKNILDFEQVQILRHNFVRLFKTQNLFDDFFY